MLVFSSDKPVTVLLVPSLMSNDSLAVTSVAALTDTIILFTTTTGGLVSSYFLLVKLLTLGLSEYTCG